MILQGNTKQPDGGRPPQRAAASDGSDRLGRTRTDSDRLGQTPTDSDRLRQTDGHAESQRRVTQQAKTYPHSRIPAARLFFVILCFSVFSSTWGNPEVRGGDHFLGSPPRKPIFFGFLSGPGPGRQARRSPSRTSRCIIVDRIVCVSLSLSLYTYVYIYIHT